MRSLSLLWLSTAVLVVVSACSGGTSPPLSMDIEPATSVMASEVGTAVRAAAASLLNSPGIAIRQSEEVDGVVASRLWMDYRPESGEFLMVESVDTLIRSRRTEDDGGVLTTATLLVADSLYVSVAASADMPEGASVPWQMTSVVSEQASAYMPPFIDLRSMAEGGSTSNREVLDAYRRDSTSDTTEWILISPFEGGTATQSWMIDRNGNLETYTIAFEGDVAALEGPKGLPSNVHVEFASVDEPGPIDRPTVGDPLELDSLSLP